MSRLLVALLDLIAPTSNPLDRSNNLPRPMYRLLKQVLAQGNRPLIGVV